MARPKKAKSNSNKTKKKKSTTTSKEDPNKNGLPGSGSSRDDRRHEAAAASGSGRRGLPADSSSSNFCAEAGPGCHIARRRREESVGVEEEEEGSWVIEWEDVDPDDYDEEEDGAIPDLAVGDGGVLVLCNIRDGPVVAYITVYGTVLRGRNGRTLEPGATTDEDGTSRPCTTLIVLCPGRAFAHLCRIDDEAIADNPELLDLDSDVQEWNRHPHPDDTHARTIRFPFRGDADAAGGGPYLCTQGEGGHLTHFFSGNMHAVDFRCPVGTPVLAAGDGIVVDVKDSHQRLMGIAVSNLFRWNSILLQLLDRTPADADADADAGDSDSDSAAASPPFAVDDDRDPLFVEYVHIQSSRVRTGDRVEAGQVIGTTGSVGFSPEPHLHLAAYRSSDPAAATVRVCFESTRNRGETFLPRAGCFYNSEGQVEVDPTP
jgi:hypothetical protein